MDIASVFQEVAAILLVATVLGAIAIWLRQPLIVAFIAVGVLVGPVGFGIVSSTEEIDLLAELGIALLLFVVGLKLDLRLIRSVGPVALATGLGQVLFTSVVGFAIALALGLGTTAALFVAVAITFSSTIIIVKLLSDKRELEELHGRIAVGFLIVQDIAVILAMIGLTAFGAGEGTNDVSREILLIFVKGAILLASVALLMRFVLTPLFNRLAHSPELMVLAAISLAVGMAALADLLGFSKEVGAFLGGVALASTPYREAIGARLVPLRDFLLLFFFIALGSGMDLGDLGDQLGTALVLSLFVLIGNPLIVMVIMGVMGYRKRVGFLAGLTVSQISEFSLILGALGVSIGVITDQDLALITAVGLITISASTYAILNSQRLYELLEPWLGVFERDRRQFAGDNLLDGDSGVDAIVFGLGRYGRRIATELELRGLNVMGVDLDPVRVADWGESGHSSFYGDLEDTELPTELPLAGTELIVSSVADRDANLAMLHAIRGHGFEGRIAVTSHHEDEAAELHRRGADEVLCPFAVAAEVAVAELAEAGRAGSPPGTDQLAPD
jgi:Kef-type K+ transport system membrane component KefB